MRLVRSARLLLVVFTLMSLLSVATASAASSNPLFLPVNNQTLTGLGGPSTLKTAFGVITCQKDSATGIIANSLLVGKVFVHYLECTAVSSEGGTTRCTVKTKEVIGENEGLILTRELHGILGLILSPAPLDTGVLFLPASGKIFAEFEEARNGSTKCIPASKMSGTVAGLITPVGVHTTKGLLVFPKASITKIDLTHGLGLREPELNFFAATATLEQHDILTFGEPTGIT